MQYIIGVMSCKDIFVKYVKCGLDKSNCECYDLNISNITALSQNPAQRGDIKLWKGRLQ